MKWLDVYPPVKSGVFHYLREFVDKAPTRIRRSCWRVDEFVEPNHEPEFDVTGDHLVERLEVLKLGGGLFDFEELCSLADEDGQIIWASFFGYDDRKDDKPWIAMSAVDSSFWRFDTKDMSVRNWVRSTFENVRIGQP